MSLLVRLQHYFQAIATVGAGADAPQVEPLLADDVATTPLLAAPPGFIRTPILACTPASFLPAAGLPGLSFVTLASDAPLAAVQANLDTNARGFDPAAPPATAEEAAAFRATLTTNRAVTAIRDGHPVAAGMFTPPHSGLAEIVGIATLVPFRGRGIGAALTSEIVRVAFAQGVDTVFLQSDNPVALRLYRRLGFQPVAVRLVAADGGRALA